MIGAIVMQQLSLYTTEPIANCKKLRCVKASQELRRTFKGTIGHRCLNCFHYKTKNCKPKSLNECCGYWYDPNMEEVRAIDDFIEACAKYSSKRPNKGPVSLSKPLNRQEPSNSPAKTSKDCR